MKKKIAVLLALVMLFTAFAALAGCGSKSGDGGSGDDKTITVGASPAPHAEILNVAKELLAEEGYTIEIKEYNDYILPNNAVENGELDANFFQHITYMNDFNEENGTHLVAVAKTHYEPMGLYPGKTASIDELKEGASIAIPNDGTNEARALFLLEAQGLIKLKDGIDFTATKLDIEENPMNLDIIEMEAAQLVRALEDVDMAVINGNYAITAGLSIDNVLAIESADSDAATAYVNVLAVKEGNENNEAIQALVKALTSDEVKNYINETYGDAVVPVF